MQVNVLIATGLVLFVITFVVNFAARWIVGRSERRHEPMTPPRHADADPDRVPLHRRPPAAPGPAARRRRRGRRSAPWSGCSAGAGRARRPRRGARLHRRAARRGRSWSRAAARADGPARHQPGLDARSSSPACRWSRCSGRCSPNGPAGPRRAVPHLLDAQRRRRDGGIYHAIIGTLLITALAPLISVPIGTAAAIYLVEYGRATGSRAASRSSST